MPLLDIQGLREDRFSSKVATVPRRLVLLFCDLTHGSSNCRAHGAAPVSWKPRGGRRLDARQMETLNLRLRPMPPPTGMRMTLGGHRAVEKRSVISGLTHDLEGIIAATCLAGPAV